MHVIYIFLQWMCAGVCEQTHRHTVVPQVL